MTDKESEVYHISIMSQVTNGESGILWCGEAGELPPEDEGMELCRDCLMIEALAYRFIRQMAASLPEEPHATILTSLASMIVGHSPHLRDDLLKAMEQIRNQDQEA